MDFDRNMTVSRMREFAFEQGISLAGLRLKAEIAGAIESALPVVESRQIAPSAPVCPEAPVARVEEPTTATNVQAFQRTMPLSIMCDFAREHDIYTGRLTAKADIADVIEAALETRFDALERVKALDDLSTAYERWKVERDARKEAETAAYAAAASSRARIQHLLDQGNWQYYCD